MCTRAISVKNYARCGYTVSLMHHVSRLQSCYAVSKQPARSIIVIVLCLTYSNAAECTPSAAVMCDEDTSCVRGSTGYTCGEDCCNVFRRPRPLDVVLGCILGVCARALHTHHSALNVTDAVVPGTALLAPFVKLLPRPATLLGVVGERRHRVGC